MPTEAVPIELLQGPTFWCTRQDLPALLKFTRCSDTAAATESFDQYGVAKYFTDHFRGGCFGNGACDPVVIRVYPNDPPAPRPETQHYCALCATNIYLDNGFWVHTRGTHEAACRARFSDAPIYPSDWLFQPSN